jgi:uncharacterized protein (TIGR02271 family)
MNEMKPDSGDAREIVVPLLEEQLSVSKRVMAKSRVQISTVTRQYEELVDELLTREHVEIERTPIGRRVNDVPRVREEGDTTIVPVVEEVVVVQRQLILKEEVRIRRVRETERHQERVTLRKQEATVTRLPVEEEAAASAATADGREEIK